jgi:hypothetical protein
MKDGWVSKKCCSTLSSLAAAESINSGSRGVMDGRITWETWRELEAGTISYGRLNARALSSGAALGVDHEGRRHLLLPVVSLEAGVTDAK